MIERLAAALSDRYRIERRLGAGGMATVYLAEDLKHERKVAVKVLKPELAAVLGAERFVTEIKTTASLQHPHILPLFDSGEADGFLYYVMPYVEGETLRDSLDRETQLGVEEAVRITTEVADALDYAHRQGIIHRDIKPENILLHDGRPMVVDFGIALAVSAAAGGRMTETGTSIGTPHYMSPEQATADRELTARADVYSLASVLYEMLVGDPPHTGSSAQAVIFKIVAEPAQRLGALRKSVPPNVEAAVMTALEKLPADRFESAKAFADALADPGFAASVTAPAAGGRAWKRWAGLALAGWSVALVLAGVAVRASSRPVPGPISRYSITLPTRLAAADGVDRLSVSPDGSYVVFVGTEEGPASRLFTKATAELAGTPLDGTEGAGNPFVSPDGSRVGFFDRDAPGLRWVPRSGGSPTTVAGAEALPLGASWGSDSYIYFTAFEADRPGFRSIVRVGEDGGSLELVTAPDSSRGEVGHGWPSALPSGTGVVFTVMFRSGVSLAEWKIAVAGPQRGSHEVLLSGVRAWYAGGQLLYLTADGALRARPFDPSRLAFDGEAVSLAEGVHVGFAGNSTVAVSEAGTLYYATAGRRDRLYEPVWVTREGQATAVDPGWTLDPGGNNRGVALSPDASRVAFTKVWEAANVDIGVKQLPGEPVRRLTFGTAEDARPRWSPEGDSVTFVSDREGTFALYSISASGTGEANRLFGLDGTIAEALNSPDGEWLIMRSGGLGRAPGGRDVWAARPGVDTVPLPLIVTDRDEKAIALSPGGQWLAYESNETGRNEIYVRPFPDSEAGEVPVSTAGGVMPVWAPEGSELFYVDAEGRMIAARVRTDPDFAVLDRTVLFTIDRAILMPQDEQYALYDVAPDGRFFMLRAAGAPDAPSEVIVVENVFEALRSEGAG